MTEKTEVTEQKHLRKMKQFYFQHTLETRLLSEELRAKENLEFAAWVRRVFNAGLKAYYNIDMVDNKPVQPENGTD